MINFIIHARIVLSENIILVWIHRHLSQYEEINNNFIIASRAYFLQLVADEKNTARESVHEWGIEQQNEIYIHDLHSMNPNPTADSGPFYTTKDTCTRPLTPFKNHNSTLRTMTGSASLWHTVHGNRSKNLINSLQACQ